MSVKLLRTIIVLAFLLLASVIFSTSLGSHPAKQLNTSNIIAEVNKLREDKGIKPLVMSPALMSSAKAKCSDETDLGYFAHDRPNGDSPWVFFTQAKYSYKAAGENLADNITDLKGLIDSWHNSPEHYKNMISADYTETGVAICKDADSTLVVQHFAKPQ